MLVDPNQSMPCHAMVLHCCNLLAVAFIRLGQSVQVEMELLAKGAGWMLLLSLSQEDVVLKEPAIWDA